MRSRRATRLLTSWIAALAILMAALAPSISHALATKGASTWVQICSAWGAAWVQPHDGSGGAPPPNKPHSFDHCPYCSLQAHAFAIPAAPTARVPVASPRRTPPNSDLAAPCTRYAWVGAQPRAPPPFS
ncbi:MAG TPA: DUF2946 domain-containing protein [Burkholderiaceae bacterium]|nr:DUF2946 domain-containing protein [Burkholderiaceae bacterium]